MSQTNAWMPGESLQKALTLPPGFCTNILIANIPGWVKPEFMALAVNAINSAHPDQQGEACATQLDVLRRGQSLGIVYEDSQGVLDVNKVKPAGELS